MRASQAEDADLARTENLFRTIRRAADKRKSERRAAAAIGRVQMLALPALSGALQIVVNIPIMSTVYSFEGEIR
jgi:hypothetical protein